MIEDIKKKKEVNVTINAESESATRMKLRSGKFEVIIDEPTSMGGSDMGPRNLIHEMKSAANLF